MAETTPANSDDRDLMHGEPNLRTISQVDGLTRTPDYMSSAPGTPSLISRSSSYFDDRSVSNVSYDDTHETPSERITFLDLFDGLAIPTQLEKLQATLNVQKEKLKRRQQIIRSQSAHAKDLALAELRKRMPTAEERLARYRSRMKKSVDKINKNWNETMTITLREKISFMSAVLNIFISGYLIGGLPEYFYYWFTAQFCYFMPIRYFTYHRRGYHYFLADLCYFVNALALLSIWAFPRSKRLFISTYCLAYGNNAVAIVMWRNSLVFHSLDKVTSLFIHLMPPVMLHCLVHLTPASIQQSRFPAIYNIKFSAPDSAEHYNLWQMLIWATLPYAIWQVTYHFFITVRKRELIAAGRPTSFTWLRKSYATTWIGKVVLSLPASLQEPAFMLIQYLYACLTIIPCPLWFWYRWASVAFLMFVFSWSIWNGANYYMDVFGKKFQKELEQMRKEMERMQQSPNLSPQEEESDKKGLNGLSLDEKTTDDGGVSSGLEKDADGSDARPRRSTGLVQ